MKKPLVLLSFIFTLLGCDKNETIVKVIPTITTTELTNITGTKAISGGKITENGGANVTAKGVCWSTSTSPTTTDSHTNDGTGTGSFTSQLTNLSENTTYFIRSYATNSVGTVYGNQLTFSTLALPTITTTELTNITGTKAISGGKITENGGANVTAKGVCWSTSTSPTTTDSHTNDGTGTGSFTSQLTNLSENTTYYLRSYATNSVGTVYGNELSFTTSKRIPVLTTLPITEITPNRATSGGNLTNNGGGNITANGVCWSTLSNPTISDDFTVDSSGTASFTSFLSNLRPNTTYFLKSYATNEAGTGYGNELSFTTSELVLYGSTTITTQEHIDYIEERGYSKVEGGGVYISGSNITNLEGLSSLHSITGDLGIYNTTGLTNLIGLGNLNSLGGKLIINLNKALINLEGLNKLTTIGEYVDIQENDALASLDGLNNLTAIEHYLFIYNNNSLTTISGLNNLKSIGYYLNINSNALLENLDGLSNLESIGQSLIIMNNNSLVNINGLSSLTSTGSLSISSNTALNNLCGIRPLIGNNGNSGNFNITSNSFNPTLQDIKDNNCSQ